MRKTLSVDLSTPPLTEMALTIQFEPQQRILGPELGRFWERCLLSSFPVVEQHNPIDQVIELERGLPVGGLRLEVGVPSPRYFFMNEQGDRLVQLQSDRISLNWRRLGDAYDYPHYEVLRAEFEQHASQLANFIILEELGELNPNQCEVLYANTVHHFQSTPPHREVGQLIKPWDSDHVGLGGADFEDVRIHARHTIRDDDGKFRGRIHLNVDPAYLVAEKQPVTKIQLTARGWPFQPNLRGAFEFLDLAHDMLRRAFSDVIAEDVQESWIRANDS